MYRSLLLLAALAIASTACTVDIDEAEPVDLVEPVTEADDSLVETDAVDHSEDAELSQRDEPMQPVVDDAVWQSEHAATIDPIATQTRW